MHLYGFKLTWTQYLFFALCVSLLSCNDVGRSKCPNCSSPELEKGTISQKSSKNPIVNVYMENSGSMFGYVNQQTEFEESVYSYLSDICLSSSDSMNLYYINSRILPQKRNQKLSQNLVIKDFITRLTPGNFVQQGGNLAATDISEMLTNILEKTGQGDVSIFISDCVFSPGSGVDAGAYLVNQQIGVKAAIVNKLKQCPDFCMLTYRLNSRFRGFYYNRLNQRKSIDDVRPFYMILMGRTSLINQIVKNVPQEKIKGSGVECSYLVCNTKSKAKYEIKNSPKKGSFKKCMKSPKYHIYDAKKSAKGLGKEEFMFSIGADFSYLPLGDDYLLNPASYEVSTKDYILSVTKPKSSGEVDEKGHLKSYPYILHLTLDDKLARPISTSRKGITVKLMNALPSWVEQFTDEDDLNLTPESLSKTYGLKYLMEGIKEGFAHSGSEALAEIKVYVN